MRALWPILILDRAGRIIEAGNDALASLQALMPPRIGPVTTVGREFLARLRRAPVLADDVRGTWLFRKDGALGEVLALILPLTAGRISVLLLRSDWLDALRRPAEWDALLALAGRNAKPVKHRPAPGRPSGKRLQVIAHSRRNTGRLKS